MTGTQEGRDSLKAVVLPPLADLAGELTAEGHVADAKPFDADSVQLHFQPVLKPWGTVEGGTLEFVANSAGEIVAGFIGATGAISRIPASGITTEWVMDQARTFVTNTKEAYGA